MKHLVRTAVLGSAATLALVAGACAPAFADSDSSTNPSHPTHQTQPHHTQPHHTQPQTLAAIQASGKAKTSERIVRLDKAIAKITAAKHLSNADRSKILGTLKGDVTGMHTVEAKIAADTTVTTAAADYQTIFTGYRVYAVAIPQSRFAAAADRLTSTTIPKLTDAHSKLAVALAKDPSKSTPALIADLADMKAKTSAAAGLVDGLAAKSLDVTPVDFNGNHDVLKPERASLESAIADVKKAAADGKKVRTALK